jgi:hypothetical protein
MMLRDTVEPHHAKCWTEVCDCQVFAEAADPKAKEMVLFRSVGPFKKDIGMEASEAFPRS